MRVEGLGKGNRNNNEAIVDSEGRLSVRAVTSSGDEHALNEGRRFGVYSATINLSSAARTAVFYLKNGQDEDIEVTGITISTGVSDAATNEILIEQIGGILATDDIVVNGTDKKALNSNTGSANEFAGIVKIGAHTDFAIGSLGAATGVRGEFTTAQTFDILTQIPKGGEIGTTITPPAGNTNMNLTFTATFHIIDDL
jgi:hypothetical protein